MDNQLKIIIGKVDYTLPGVLMSRFAVFSLKCAFIKSRPDFEQLCNYGAIAS